MRLFCAIDIPAGVKAGLQALTDRLRPLAKLSWSAAANFHVTTKFIGEWPDARLDEITGALTGVTSSEPIDIAVRGLGWFPNDRNPRVLWAGIEASEALRTLAHETEHSLVKVGVPAEDRGFHPHLTVARRRNPTPVDRLRQEVAQIQSADFGSFRAESFFLYLSKGGRYSKLQEFPLLSRL